MKRIVALRSGALGDCVVSFPALKLLRRSFPQSEITLIGDPYGGPVLAASGYADRTLCLTHSKSKLPYLKQLVDLRRERYDLLVDFQASGHSRIQVGAIGGAKRLGLDKRHWMANFLYTNLINLDPTVHAAKRIANTLSPLGIELEDHELTAELQLQDRHRARARKLIAERAIPGPYVVLQATTGYRPEYRRWPSDRFAEVADHLSSLGYSVVLTSARTAQPVLEIEAAVRKPVYNLSGSTDPLVLGAILEGAALYVGYNTGPMHLAASVGTPIVALFDVPSDPVQWHPLTNAPYKLVKAKAVPVSPGWRLDTVQTGEVIEAIDDLLPQTATYERELIAVGQQRRTS